MAASVQVLCPNGRRQNVKINPNTKLLQVLEEVCKLQGFSTPDEYKLIHGRKDLDLSLSLRFAGIPNNAKLELAKAPTARQEQDVTIALQLESGERLQHSFSPSEDLWSLLLKYEAKYSQHKDMLTRSDSNTSPPVHPVCIYMREEVVSKSALMSTTLRRLGLTSGRAIIRLVHRPVDQEQLQKIQSEIEKAKQKQERLEEIATKKIEEQNLVVSAPHLESRIDDIPSDSGENRLQQLPEIEEEAMDVSVDQATPGHLNQVPAQGQNTAIEELRAINIPGVEIFTPDEFNHLSQQEQEIARRLAQRLMPALQAQQAPEAGPGRQERQAGPSNPANPASAHSNHTQRHQRPPDSFPLANFKFPESTKGQDLNQCDSEASNSGACQPCPRDVMVYNLDEDLLESHSQEISEDFFEVTTDDVKKMYKDLQNAVQRMEDAPLMTQALKHSQLEAAYDDYERIVIRVQFPDKLVLQAFFKPREKVSALYSCVQEALESKDIKFYLYTSPPKNILKDKNKSFAISNLAPAAVVYFGCSQDQEHFLSETLVSSCRVPRVQAESAVAQALQARSASDVSTSSQDPRPGPSSSSVDPPHSAPRRPAPSSFNSAPRTTLPSGAKVPKWFKTGK